MLLFTISFINLFCLYLLFSFIIFFLIHFHFSFIFFYTYSLLPILLFTSLSFFSCFSLHSFLIFPSVDLSCFPFIFFSFSFVYLPFHLHIFLPIFKYFFQGHLFLFCFRNAERHGERISFFCRNPEKSGILPNDRCTTSIYLCISHSTGKKYWDYFHLTKPYASTEFWKLQ